MGSKEKLTELMSNMPEWQASALLMITQSFMQAVKDAETKGRVDISSEVIKYLSEAGPQQPAGGFDMRPQQPPVRMAPVPPPRG